MKQKEQEVIEQREKKSNIIEISKTPTKGSHWYIIHTYSGHENKVANTLMQVVESKQMQNKISKILIPSQEKIVISEGKKRTVDEKLFPGYILIHMKMDDETWFTVRSTAGVTGFVGAGAKPTPLPESEVRSIEKFTEMPAPKFEAKFKVGDAVKVIDGIFIDNIGKVDEVNKDQGKVKVLVSVFGRETPVELDFLQISPL